MALYGAIPHSFHEFRGLCSSVDATEIDPALSPDTLNMDFEGEILLRRRGSTAYNSTIPTGASNERVRGLTAYYPRSGTRSIVFQAGTRVYADRNQDGDFGDANEVLLSSMTGGTDYDFWQYRNKLYGGSNADAVFSWDGSSTAGATLATITAPAAKATLAVARDVVEAFDSGSWTLFTGSTDLTTAYETTLKREGTGCLQITAPTSSSLGEGLFRTFGATVDLSKCKHVNLWVRSSQPGVEIQPAFYADGTTPAVGTQPDWDKFRTCRIIGANTWYQYHIDLENMLPDTRDAVPGMAVRFQSDGGRGFDPDIVVSLDDARAQGLMTPDHYSYYYTYREEDADGNLIRESEPSAVAEIDLPADSPFRGVSVTVVASGDSSVNKIGIYRKRKDGFWGRPRLVARVANSSATYTDTRADDDVTLDVKSVNLIEFRDVPPKAKTFAMVGQRLFAGNVNISSVQYPYRIYISAFGDPESFSPSEHVNVDDPNAAGWVDLPRGVEVLRIMDFEGQAVIFCRDSVWTIAGSSWGGADPFRLKPRARVGLLNRNAVIFAHRLFFFASEDGIRVLAPNHTFDGSFDTQVISEPIRNLIRDSFPASTDLVFGLDELGRIHCIDNDSVGVPAAKGFYVFDPRHPGALAPGYNPQRYGWTRYSSWGWACFLTLRADGTDQGQLLGGSTSTGRISYVQVDSTGQDIAYTGGFHWYSRVLKPPRQGEQQHVRYTRVARTSQTSDEIDVNLRLERTTNATEQTMTGTADAFTEQILMWSKYARQVQVFLSGDSAGTQGRHSFNEVEVGVYASR